MEKEKEKKILYNSLADLTERSLPEVYFSKERILYNLKSKIEKETHGDIYYRKCYVNLNSIHFKGEEVINLDEILPTKKNLKPFLEELVEEGKIQRVLVSTGDHDSVQGHSPIYRAVL